MTTPWQPGFQGVTVVPAGYNDPHNWSPSSALQQVASLGAAGFALQNATPTILTWAVPNDNTLHVVQVFGMLDVTSPETGGGVNVQFTDPAGSTHTSTLFAGGQAASSFPPNAFLGVVKPGSTVSVLQVTNLTAGAATVWASIWAA